MFARLLDHNSISLFTRCKAVRQDSIFSYQSSLNHPYKHLSHCFDQIQKSESRERHPSENTGSGLWLCSERPRKEEEEMLVAKQADPDAALSRVIESLVTQGEIPVPTVLKDPNLTGPSFQKMKDPELPPPKVAFRPPTGRPSTCPMDEGASKHGRFDVSC